MLALRRGLSSRLPRMFAVAAVAGLTALFAGAAPAQAQTTSVFSGAKVNAGMVTYALKDGRPTLTLSSDFVVPDTPAPHWQVVDTAGNTYLLQRLKIKGDKVNSTIIIPSYVPDIAKVQVWCSWAEALLGEASFSTPVTITGTAVKPMPPAASSMTHTSMKFMGPKANMGTVTHSVKDGKSMLTLSDDFVVPDTPAPHWQIVDSKGATYLLQRLPIKGDKVNRTIVVPAYIPDIAKVQIWCAYAETNLGEASFDKPVK